MSTMTLLASLKTLEAKLRLLTPVSDVFHAETIPGCAWARLAVGINGLALMLPKISEPTMAPVNLPNVAVRFNVRPQIEIEGASTLEEIVFVETKSNEASVQRAFLDVVAMLLSSGRYGHAADVRQLIEDFMELFRSLAGTPRNSALGLWGEAFDSQRSAGKGFAYPRMAFFAERPIRLLYRGLAVRNQDGDWTSSTPFFI